MEIRRPAVDGWTPRNDESQDIFILYGVPPGKGAWRSTEELVVDFHIGEILRLRKPHPCGEDRWLVVRLGADIGLRCLGCNHRVLIERHVLERRVKSLLNTANEIDINSNKA